MSRTVSIQLTINGRATSLDVDTRVNLADTLRHVAGLTGTHVGCEHGVCGACTVIVDNRPVRSCLMLVVQAEGTNIETIEGLANKGELSTLQKAFSEHHALQCGFCTPGMLMTIESLLRETPDPTEEDVRIALSGNLCRCTGYQGIVEATLATAKTLRQEKALGAVAP